MASDKRSLIRRQRPCGVFFFSIATIADKGLNYSPEHRVENAHIMDLANLYQRIIARSLEVNGRPKSIADTKPDLDIHHIIPAAFFEGGRRNKKANQPSNLVYLSYREHYLAHMLLAKIHGGAMWLPFSLMKDKLNWHNSRFYNLAREKAIAWMKENTSWRDNQARSAKQRSQDPLWISMMDALRKDPIFESKRVEGLRRAWATPEANERKKKAKIILQETIARPSWRSAQKKGCEKRNADPEYQEKMLVKNRKQHSDPAYREKLFAASSKALSIKVVRIDENTGERKIYPSMTAAKEDGYDFRKISRACQKGWRHKGFLWEKLDTDKKGS